VARRRPQSWGDLRRDWPELTAYERFETFVAALLTIIIGVVILVALYRLIASVIDLLLLRALNPLSPQVFQTVFGEILTLLIALEFNHSLRIVLLHERGIVQAKAIVLIALLAVVRKVIIADLFHTTPASVGALAAMVVALGLTYWLIRERDERSRRSPVAPGPASLPRMTL
jgi:uncharacterized membrane protein (DUF373 family)